MTGPLFCQYLYLDGKFTNTIYCSLHTIQLTIVPYVICDNKFEAQDHKLSFNNTTLSQGIMPRCKNSAPPLITWNLAFLRVLFDVPLKAVCAA